MPARDLDLLLNAAERAGDIALRHFRAAPKVWDKADNAGPVTEADLEVDAALRSHLLAERPDYGWLSEETDDDKARLDMDRVFILDPIDGTRAFIAQEDSWAHALAVAERGVVTAAVVFLPVTGELFAAARGQGATLNGDPIRVSPQPQADGASMLTTHRFMEPQNWPGGVPQVRRSFRPAIATRMALVAQGRYDALLTLRDAWEWDIAAGALLIEEAGGIVTDRLGNGLRFNAAFPKAKGVLAAGPSHGDFLKRLSVI